jgi:hypothetical protein
MKSWNVMCNVDKVVMNVRECIGELHVPKNNCPDMSSTIKCFTEADPEIKIINVYVDGALDITYKFSVNNDWISNQWTRS